MKHAGWVLAVVIGVLAGMAAGMLIGGAAVKGVGTDAADAAVSVAMEDPVVQFRTERQQLRQMQISQLNELIHGGAEEEIVLMAQRRLMELMDWTEKETTLEGVLRMREFEDVVATVHSDSVSIIVRAQSLTRQQTAVILELVMRETGISGGNVKIIPIN